MATITETTRLSGVLTNATSVTLSNSDNNKGIIRNDTGATIVAAGVAFTNTSTGVYSYVFTPPTGNVFYTAYVKVVASTGTIHNVVVFFQGLTETLIMIPSAIIGKYVTTTLGIFTAVSSNTTWPLYRSSLPDGNNVEDDAAAIYDSAGFLQGKHMGGELDQRYGIGFMLRSTNYDTGYQKLSGMLLTLENKENVDVAYNSQTFRIYNVSQTTPIISLGVEEGSKQRYIFSVKLLVSLKEV